MATPLIDIANEKGWWAAIAFIGVMAFRGFTVGRRIGSMEQIQLDQGKQLDYLIERLDTHIDSGSA